MTPAQNIIASEGSRLASVAENEAAESACSVTRLLAVWREEFDTRPIDAGDIMANPAVREAFAAAMPWPIAHLNARIVGRHIRRLMGDAVMKLPTHRAFAQRWSLK